MAFYMTDEDAHTNKDYVMIELSWGGANGNQLSVFLYGDSAQMLGVEVWGNGSMHRTS